MTTQLKPARAVVYPESDGKPMAETEEHLDCMVDVRELLKDHFTGRQVYVGANMFLYYVEGEPSKVVSPDVFVALDCDPRRRRFFKTWVEGRVPDFVLEVTSRKTRREDQGRKKRQYAELGVAEYFLFDPLGEYLSPRLQGHRLVAGEYDEVPPGSDGELIAERLGLALRAEGNRLVLADRAAGRRLKLRSERLAEETAARRQAEARIRELEAEIARLRGEGKR